MQKAPKILTARFPTVADVRPKHYCVKTQAFKARRNTNRQRGLFTFAIASIGSLVSLCGSPAHAQSTVTLYGTLDAGIQYTSKADGQHSSVNLQSYGLMPSEFGLIGEEDLGGGVKAVFRLEQGINVNDGTSTAPGYAFFRGSYVGLSGNFGTITLGRQYSVLFDRTVFFDPLYFAAYSAQGLLIPVDQNFLSSSVKWQSEEYSGISAEALAATQGVAGNSRAGRVLELGAQYSGNGFGVSGVIHQSWGSVSSMGDTSALQQVIGTLAARYALGSAIMFAGVERQTGPLAPSKTVAWGGARYQVTPFVGLAGGVYHTFSNDPNVGNPTLYVLSATYALSKRTVAYVNVSYSHNTQMGSQTVYEYNVVPLNGASQVGAIVGILHHF